MSSNTNDTEHELTHSMAHYLLTIHKLKEERGYARVTDIAKDLGITKGSVSTALGSLKKKGFVEEDEDSKFLLLSNLGHNEVHKILSNRTLLFYFLKDFIGVQEEIAQRDSCMMEHLLSEESQKKFFDFMKTLACACEKQSTEIFEKYDFKTTLDLCKYETNEDFKENQKGDSHL